MNVRFGGIPLPKILFAVAAVAAIASLVIPVPVSAPDEPYPSVRLGAPDSFEPSALQGGVSSTLRNAVAAATRDPNRQWALLSISPKTKTSPRADKPALIIPPLTPIAPRLSLVLPVDAVLLNALPVWPEPNYGAPAIMDLTVREYDRVFVKERNPPYVGDVTSETADRLTIKLYDSGGTLTINKSSVRSWEKKQDLTKAIDAALASVSTPDDAVIFCRVILEKQFGFQYQKRAFDALHSRIEKFKQENKTPSSIAYETQAILPLTKNSLVRSDPLVIGWALDALDALSGGRDSTADRTALAGDYAALSGDWRLAKTLYETAQARGASDSAVSVRLALAGAATATAGSNNNAATKAPSVSAIADAARAIRSNEPDRAISVLFGVADPAAVDVSGPSISVEAAIERRLGRPLTLLKSELGLHGPSAYIAAAAFILNGEPQLAKALLTAPYESSIAGDADILSGILALSENKPDLAISYFTTALSRPNASRAPALTARARAYIGKLCALGAPKKRTDADIIANTQDIARTQIETAIRSDITDALAALGLDALPTDDSEPPVIHVSALAELTDMVLTTPFPIEPALSERVIKWAERYAGEPQQLLASAGQLPDLSLTPGAVGALAEPPIIDPDADIETRRRQIFNSIIYADRLIAPGAIPADASNEAVAAIEADATARFETIADALTDILISRPDDSWAAQTLTALDSTDRIKRTVAQTHRPRLNETYERLSDDLSKLFGLRPYKNGAPLLTPSGIQLSGVPDALADPAASFGFGRAVDMRTLRGFSATVFIDGDNEAEIGIGFIGQSSKDVPAVQYCLLAHTREQPDDASRSLIRTQARLDYAGALKEATDEAKTATTEAAAALSTLPVVNPPKDILAIAQNVALKSWDTAKKAMTIIDRASVFLPSKDLDALTSALRTQISDLTKVVIAVEHKASIIVIPPFERNTLVPKALLADVTLSPSLASITTPRARYYGKLGRETTLSCSVIREDNAVSLSFAIDGKPIGVVPVEMPATTDPQSKGQTPLMGQVVVFATAQSGQTIAFEIRSFAFIGDRVDQRNWRTTGTRISTGNRHQIMR
ncbi:MAG: hypothetical protein ABIH86_07550 [Planctomycetota bacterium]